MAALCEKQHDNVLKTIRLLVERGVVLNTIPQTYVHEQNGQCYTEFLSDKRDSLVIVARLSPEFTAAVVDRWQDLEQQPQIPQSFAEALQLAADQAKQLELAAPKVDAYDKLIDSTHLKTVGEVAKSIGLRSAQQLNDKLDVINAYDSRCSNRVWSGWFVEQGLGRMITTKDGYSSNKMTGKGQAWALDLFGGNE